jgi:hypothetical protein
MYDYLCLSCVCVCVCKRTSTLAVECNTSAHFRASPRVLRLINTANHVTVLLGAAQRTEQWEPAHASSPVR